MDPNYEDEEEEDAEAQAMAAAMGFSGFGKPQAKRRKFNSSSDAFVEGQELAKLDKGGKKGQGSGGNTIPLGKPRVFGGGGADMSTPIARNTVREERVAIGNKDEINLDDDIDNGEGGPNYIDSSRTPPAAVMEGNDSVDQDRPPPVSEEEAKEMQARIDAILAGIGQSDEPSHVPSENSTVGSQHNHDIPRKTLYGDTAFMRGNTGDAHGTASVASSSRPNHRGERNPTWYIGYYDPSFNENPWDKLEKERGLQPLCKWPEHVGLRQQT